MSRIIIFLFLIYSSLLQAQRFGIDVYSVDQGLPTYGVFDLEQDSLGRLWVATEGEGVACFNGLAFSRPELPKELLSGNIRCIRSLDKEMWIGTEEKGTFFTKKGSWKKLGTDQGLNSPHIRFTIRDSSGSVWIGMIDGGVQCFSGDSLSTPKGFEKWKNSSFRDALIDHQSRLWIAGDSGLFLHAGESPKKQNYPEIKDNPILSIFEDSRSQMWIGTLNGLFVLGDDSLRSIKGELSTARIRSIAEDAFGNIWVGTKDGCHLLSGDGQQLQSIGEANGLSNNRIRKIYRDASNSMWIGTYFGGICRINQLCTQYFDARSGYSDHNITALSKDSLGYYWFGSFEGQVYRYDGEILERIYDSYRFNDNHINVIRAGKEGVFVGTSEDGLILIRGDRKIKIPGPKCIIDLCLGDAGKAWLITENKVYHLDRRSLSVKELQGIELLPSTRFNVLSYHSPELLLGTDKGLFQLQVEEEGKVIIAQKWTEELQSVAVNCIAQDSLGNSWIGTAGEGIYRYNSKKFKNFNSRRYLESPYIRFIAIDDNQNLWLADATQISQIELDPDQSIVLNSSNLEEVNELGRLEPNYRAVLSDKDGSMWFGTINGLIRFKEGMSFPDLTEPPLALKDLLVNNNSLSWDTTNFELNRYGLPKKPVFDYDENQLTIEFFATEPSAQDKVVYQYKLEGYSSDWSPISSKTSASFPRLPPGDYTFKLRARNRDGIWNSNPLTYSFEIEAPFYQQPWLIVLAILVFASLIAGFVRLRLGVLKRRNIVLEERVSERTAELNQEKRKSEELLLNILPRETAEELKEKGAAKAREYPMVSVLFSDFEGFTRLAENMNSEEVVATLDECFRAFDQHTDELGIEKIKTIGDAYMCASGLPHFDERHAHKLVEFAFRMLREVEKMNYRRKQQGKESWPIRIGIHSGSVVAGVVGKKKFAYDIWGDTVNTAARMESSGEAGKINISRSTRELIADEFPTISRGKLEAKNKGALEMYFVKPKKA